MNIVPLNTRGTCFISFCFSAVSTGFSLLTEVFLLGFCEERVTIFLLFLWKLLLIFFFNPRFYLRSIHTGIPQASIIGSFLYLFIILFFLNFYLLYYSGCKRHLYICNPQVDIFKHDHFPEF